MNLSKDQFEDLVDKKATFKNGITLDEIMSIANVSMTQTNYTLLGMYFRKDISYSVLQKYIEL